MKKIIFLVVVLLQTVTLFSQASKEDYLKKSKNQKKTANILLAGGGALLLAYFVIPEGERKSTPIGGNLVYNTHENDGIRAVFFITGALSVLTSIPYYLSSAKNKRRANAINLTIRNQEIVLPHQGNLVFKKQPAVTLKVAL